MYEKEAICYDCNHFGSCDMRIGMVLWVLQSQKQRQSSHSDGNRRNELPGYHIDQLREVWGKPDTSEDGTVCWKIGDTTLIVSYKNNGIVAICGLKDDSGVSIGE